MSKPGTWGDHLVLSAASALYKRRLVVVQTEGPSIPVIAKNVPQTADIIFVGYYVLDEEKSHYVSLTLK
jgi:hypothetical protein